VPYRLLKAFHKVQQRLVRELEKKFSGKDVVLIANRRIMRAGTSGRSNDRPRSRTLTAVSRAPPMSRATLLLSFLLRNRSLLFSNILAPSCPPF
jgi:hypothetical protein